MDTSLDAAAPASFLRPSIRSVLLSFLVHHNPFYLLSALSMLAGCYALNSGLDTHPGDIGKLLLLIGTLNVYEFLLIGLGLYLIRRRGLLRDGRTLLLLEATFLVDLAFLNAEAAQVSLATGVLINSIALLLAWLKVTVAARVLNGRLPGRSLGYILLQLAVLFALPCAFKWCARGVGHNGHVSHEQFYAAWWVVGLMLMCGELLRRMHNPTAVSFAPPRAWLTLRKIYFVLPLVSILAHLGMMHWVYRVSWFNGDLSPVLFGMSVLVARPNRLDLRAPAQAALLRVLLPLAAVGLTFNDPPPVMLMLTRHAHVGPFALSLTAAYLVYVYAFGLRYARWLVSAGIAAGAAALFGPTLAQCEAFAIACWQWTLTIVNRYMPRTALQWGLVAVSSAFAFLGIGAGLSLRHPAGEESIAAPPET